MDTHETTPPLLTGQLPSPFACAPPSEDEEDEEEEEGEEEEEEEEKQEEIEGRWKKRELRWKGRARPRG